jgi:hypothetical protein
LVLSNPSPGGCAFPSTNILTKPLHLRQDNAHPGDVVALGKGVYVKDNAMECVIVSGLVKSCLSNKARSSDFSLRLAEKAKFTKDNRSICDVASSATTRLIPLAINHHGLKGPHIQAILKELPPPWLPARRDTPSYMVLLRLPTEERPKRFCGHGAQR